MHPYQQQFIQLALDYQALQFGQFTLKSGRVSPYFFNAGRFNDGYAIKQLGQCYAACLTQHQLAYDMIFGPAYKGIPLAVATAMSLSSVQQGVAWCFDRKEVKSHGDQGQLVGAPLQGRVVVVDDVMTAGTAITHSMALLDHYGAKAAAIVVALDRQERGLQGKQSAVQQISQRYQVPVLSIIDLATLEGFLTHGQLNTKDLAAIQAYRQRYGVSAPR